MIKKITLGITLFFSTMFASPAYADWVKIGTIQGDTTYVDFDRIRTNGSYVYYWQLIDLLEPDGDGDLSYKTYHQGDCEIFRLKGFSGISYKQPMGEGSVGEINSPPDPKWIYVPPKSSVEGILKQVCAVAENL